MKLITGIATLLLLTASYAFACNSFECRKKAIMEDKTVTEVVKKELREYYAKSDKIYEDFKAKKKTLKESLSHDAKDVLYNHHKQDRKVNAKDIKPLDNKTAK